MNEKKKKNEQKKERKKRQKEKKEKNTMQRRRVSMAVLERGAPTGLVNKPPTSVWLLISQTLIF